MSIESIVKKGVSIRENARERFGKSQDEIFVSLHYNCSCGHTIKHQGETFNFEKKEGTISTSWYDVDCNKCKESSLVSIAYTRRIGKKDIFRGKVASEEEARVRAIWSRPYRVAICD